MLNSHSGMPRINPGNPSGQGVPDLAHASAAVAADGFAHHVKRPGNRGALTQGHLQHTQYEYGP